MMLAQHDGHAEHMLLVKCSSIALLSPHASQSCIQLAAGQAAVVYSGLMKPKLAHDVMTNLMPRRQHETVRSCQHHWHFQAPM
jgi:hypothetical protein